METKIQVLGTLDHVKLFFDPLRKEESFMVVKKGSMFKMGFITTEEVVLESNFDIPWSEVTSIIAGFSAMTTFERVKEKINEQAK